MLNFSSAAGIAMAEDYEVPLKKPRQSRDPMSHRIIEKRRRDRMNNCLADLSKLIPTTYLKQGQGRIEKTEIIEMSIKHIQHLQSLNMEKAKEPRSDLMLASQRFYVGYTEGMEEALRFMAQKGHNANDPLCTELLRHLKGHREQLCPEVLASPELRTKQSGATCTKPDGLLSLTSRVIYTDESSQEMTNYLPSEGLNLTELLSTDKDQQLRQFLNHQTEDTATQSKHASGQTSGRDLSSDCSYNMPITPDGSDQHCETGVLGDSTVGSEERLDSDGSRGGMGYKFKNDIKSRFNADKMIKDGRDMGDSSSVSSREDDTKCKSLSKTFDSDSASTNYPESEYSLNGSGSSVRGNSAKREPLNGSDSKQGEDGSRGVPGFALHPSGTYYMPILIAMSHLLPFLRNESSNKSVGMCHPISIPVNFSSAFPSIPNIAVGSGLVWPKTDQVFHSH